MEDLYLIAGLGNPGAEYARTRHNAGFMGVELLGRRWRADWRMEARFNAKLARIDCNGRPVMLCEPQTYMNSSGEAVGALVDYFRIEIARLLVIVDDADLRLGEIRLRPGGSAGGHHGLESVQQHLATDRYARQRIGIGRAVEGGREISGYVLGRMTPAEMKVMDAVLDRAADQMEYWLTSGIAKAMNQFNGAIDGSAKDE